MAHKTLKRRLRIERIARMDCMVPPPPLDLIAASQNVTTQYVTMLRQSPEYKAIVASLLSGIVPQLDQDLLANIENSQDTLKAMIPDALRAVYDTLLDRTNPALRLKAAESILDREGTLAKISKTEIKREVKFDFSTQDKVSDDLLAALQQNKTSVEELVDISDQFTNAALNAEQQEKLDKQIDLINAVDITPQQTSKIQ